MNHLLLDLAKVPTKTRDIPFEQARLALFVRPKAAKCLTSPEEPHGIYVLPDKNAAHSIVQAAFEILSHHPQARLAIVSPRKKLTDLIAKLQKAYPQATIFHQKKLGKKTRHFLNQQPNPLVINSQSDQHHQPNQQELLAQLHAEQAACTTSNTVTAESEFLQQTAQAIQAAAQRYTAPNPVFTLLGDVPVQPNQDMSDTLVALKKNRPKKKNDLLRLLTQRYHNAKFAEQILAGLQEQNHIQIDAAQNVRYLF